MHEIHKENYLDIAIFHHMDINLYPLFIAVYEQKVSPRQPKFYASASRSAMRCNGYDYI